MYPPSWRGPILRPYNVPGGGIILGEVGWEANANFPPGRGEVGKFVVNLLLFVVVVHKVVNLPTFQLPNFNVPTSRPGRGGNYQMGGQLADSPPPGRGVGGQRAGVDNGCR